MVTDEQYTILFEVDYMIIMNIMWNFFNGC